MDCFLTDGNVIVFHIIRFLEVRKIHSLNDNQASIIHAFIVTKVNVFIGSKQPRTEDLRLNAFLIDF